MAKFDYTDESTTFNNPTITENSSFERLTTTISFGINLSFLGSEISEM
jgi:hypothetical protein